MKNVAFGLQNPIKIALKWKEENDAFYNYYSLITGYEKHENVMNV